MSRKGGYQIIDFKGAKIEETEISTKLVNLILKSDKVLLLSGIIDDDGTKLPDMIASKELVLIQGTENLYHIYLITNSIIFQIEGEELLLYKLPSRYINCTSECVIHSVQSTPFDVEQGVSYTHIAILFESYSTKWVDSGYTSFILGFNNAFYKLDNLLLNDKLECTIFGSFQNIVIGDITIYRLV